jgi:ABC-2 type transport system ATP-binding protein
MALITVENLKKEFKRRKIKPGLTGTLKSLFYSEYDIIKAVDDISFEVDKGELIGFIGPNGAGKSTTIKMLTGILSPTSGHIEINGLIPTKDRIKYTKRIGVVFGQKTQLWWDIPVNETLNLLKHMYKIPSDQFNERLDLLNRILEINKFIDIPVRQLSLGQRMRADFCAALLHNPDIIYLDEPTIGLDVVVKRQIREFITEVNKQYGITIFLTTHDIHDIEKLCNRIMVIDKGKIVFDNNLKTLKNLYSPKQKMIIEVRDSIQSTEELKEFSISDIKVNGNQLSFMFDGSENRRVKIVHWIMAKYDVVDFSFHEEEIEDVICNIYMQKDN